MQTLVNGEGRTDGGACVRHVAIRRTLLDARPAREEAIGRVPSLARLRQTGIACALNGKAMA